jgi:hypothetical protein
METTDFNKVYNSIQELVKVNSPDLLLRTWIVAEDALDRYFVKWFEARVGNRVARTVVRLVLNPGRALSNASGGRVPWHREGRPLSWR